MRNLKKYIRFILMWFILTSSLLFSFCTNSRKNNFVKLNDSIAQGKELQIQKPIRVKAMTDEISEEDTVKVRIENIDYTIYPNGKIVILDSKTNQIDSFQLKTELIVETAYFYNYKENLIIYYVETDYDGGESFIECYERATLNMKWKNEISGFNMTTPIIIDSITYIATIGFVGKLNLNNGKYIWKHDNLYDSTKFDYFNSISIEGEKVYFTKDSTGRLYNRYGKVVVNDKTGEIEKIIKNAP
jgi:outer membrane protein assembly factor BamB